MSEMMRNNIEFLIEQVSALSIIIVDIDKEFMAKGLANMTENDIEEVQILCEDYYQLIDLLCEKLEEYFKYEKENNLPVNFVYRQAYNMLKV